MGLRHGSVVFGKVKDSRAGGIGKGRGHEVVSAQEEQLKVKLVGIEEAANVSLTPAAATKTLRLSCARTYAGCQGQTLRDLRALLLDVESPKMERHKYYVAALSFDASSPRKFAQNEQDKQWLGGS